MGPKGRALVLLALLVVSAGAPAALGEHSYTYTDPEDPTGASGTGMNRIIYERGCDPDVEQETALSIEWRDGRTGQQRTWTWVGDAPPFDTSTLEGKQASCAWLNRAGIMPRGYEQLGAVWDADRGVAHVVGGVSAPLSTGSAPSFSRYILEFDPETRRFDFADVALPPAGSPAGGRAGATVAWDPTPGVAYVFGGRAPGPTTNPGDPLDAVLRYTPGSESVPDEVVALGALPTPIEHASAAWDDTSDTAYLFGGLTDAGRTADILAFQPGTGATDVGDLPSARNGTAAFWDAANDVAYVIGGMVETATATHASAAVVRWDPADPANPAVVAELATGVTHAAVAWDPVARKAHVYGGFNQSLGNTGQRVDVIQVLDLSDAAPVVTTATETLPEPRSGMAAVWNGTHGFIIGGRSTSTIDHALIHDPDASTVERLWPERAWRPVAGQEVFPFKPGDQFRFRLRFLNMPNDENYCGPADDVDGQPGPQRVPSRAVRFHSDVLGLGGDFIELGAGNPLKSIPLEEDDVDWFTVPEVGDAFPVHGDELGLTETGSGTVRPFDRGLADGPGPALSHVLRIEAMRVCNEAPADSVSKEWAIDHLNTLNVHIPLDNTKPDVHVNVTHNARPLGNREGAAWEPMGPRSDSVPDLFQGILNATVGDTVTVTLDICDPDFDKDRYIVDVDLRRLDRAEKANTRPPFDQWQQHLSAVPDCGPDDVEGWRLLKDIEITHQDLRAIDKRPDGSGFFYDGLTIFVSDDVAPSFPMGRGNVIETTIALNVDGERPPGLATLTATPLAAGAVRLDWTFPDDLVTGQALQDLRALDVTYRALDDGTTATMQLLNVTYADPAYLAHAGLAARVDDVQDCRVTGTTPQPWTAIPRCLELTGLPLNDTGVRARVFEFVVTPRDDAGELAALPAGVVARVDPDAPAIGSGSLPAAGADVDLGTIRVPLTDESALTSVNVTIRQGTSYWDGERWSDTHASLDLTLTDGLWTVDTGLGRTEEGPVDVSVKAMDAASNSAFLNRSVVHDATPPALTIVRLADDLTTIPQGEASALRLDVSLEPRVVNVTFLAPDGTTALLHDGTTTDWTWCVSADACPEGVTLSDDATLLDPALTSWDLDLAFLADAIAIGTYDVQVTVADAAWNTVTRTYDDLFTVTPRGAIVETPLTPFLQDGSLTITVLAGYDDPDNAACDDGLCAPKVVLQTQGTQGWFDFHTMDTASSGPSGGMFTYHVESVKAPTMSRVRALVVAPDATRVLPDVAVKTPASEGAAFAIPIGKWPAPRWYVTTEATVPVAVTMTDVATGADAILLRLEPLDGSTPTAWVEATLANGVWSADIAGTRGEHTLVVCPVDGITAADAEATDCIHPARRQVAIETEPLALDVLINDLPGTTAAWTGRTLEVAAWVTTGFANVSSVDNITLEVSSSTGAFETLKAGADQVHLLTSEPTSPVYAVEAALPIGAHLVDGQTLTVRLKVVTDARDADGNAVELTFTRNLKYDAASPRILLDVLADGSPTEITGTAQDTGSGVTAVNVRIVRDDGDWWDGTAWHDGDAAAVESIAATLDCATADAAECTWSVPLTAGELLAIPLAATGRTYSITVNGRDLAGNTDADDVTRKFDNTPPGLTDAGATVTSAVAAGAVDVRVTATDAHSGVDVVTATVTLPGGATPTHDLTVSDGTWTITLSGEDIPYAGTYKVQLKATDRGGNVASAAPLSFTLADDGAPEVTDVTLAPLPVEAWRGATVTATVQERESVDAVTATLTTGDDTTGPFPLTAVDVDAVTGAGTYTLDLLDVVELGRGATYTITVTATDVNDANGAASETFQVSLNDLPRIRLEAAPVDGTYWLKPDPVLTWHVDDDGVAADGIRLEVTDGTGVTRDLTDALVVTPTSDGVRVDARVSPSLAPGSTVQFTLSVVDAEGAANATTIAATIDGTPPALDPEVTGVVVGNGTLYATRDTTVDANATDVGSGVGLVEWATYVPTSITDLDTGAVNLSGAPDALDWRPVDGAVTLGDWENLTAGILTVALRVTDHAGNVGPLGYVNLTVDAKAPDVEVQFARRVVRLGVTDAGIGVNETSLVLHHKSDATTNWTTVPFAYNASEETWEAVLPDEVSGRYFWYATGRDLAGNEFHVGTAGQPRTTYTDNQPPEVVVFVENGTVFRGNVTIAWFAEDPDATILDVTVKVIGGDGATRTLTTTRNATSIRWDSRDLADGDAVLVVTGSDGEATTVIEREVVVNNGEAARVKPPGADTFRTGDRVIVGVTPAADLPIDRVTAVIERYVAGEWTTLARPYQLELRDGQHVLDLDISSPGVYRTVFTVQYDGVVGEDTLTWGPFTVATKGVEEKDNGFNASPTFVGIALGVVAAIAAAAVAVIRLRRA